MAARLDLEARLRALRADKRPPPAPSSPPAPAASFSWPDVPSGPVQKPMATPERVAVAVGDEPQPRRSSRSFSVAPPVTIISRTSSEGSADVQEPQEVLKLTAAQLLGPAYEEAVNVAQKAIDSERRQLPHTAIDLYIRAGQMLIEIGRRQAAPHLQDIVKTKALALLQRAEGLSEWTSAVLAKDSSQQALADAYHQSWQDRYKAMAEKRELVFKMQQDNQEMKDRLNQLALLTKIKGRMKRVVSSRRARKAAEAKERAQAQAQSAAEATREVMSGRGGTAFNDVTGDVDEVEESYGDHDGPNDVTGSDEDDYQELFPRSPITPVSTRPSTQAPGGSPREDQKVSLINELHDRIGLPQIDHLRKFQPLTEDPSADNKPEELQAELEAAKQEADKLRAAVQDMEECLRLAAQHQKQRSIKLEEQKAQEFAQVQNELQRVREELENERRRSASFQSGPTSWRSSVTSDPGSEEFEDTGVMNQLRSSLHKVFRGRDDPPRSGEGGRASVQRTSYSHGSPRHTPANKDQQTSAAPDDVSEEDMEADDDGGVWL